jgi:hypothetical protein
MKARTMDLRPSIWPEMAEIATSAANVRERAQALLTPLRRVIPYAAAWIAVRNPETRLHQPVAQDGDTTPLNRYFATPDADEEIELLSLNRVQPPIQASNLPVPMEETKAWGDYLLPAGYRDGLAMGLFSEDDRHLGFLILLSDSADSVIVEDAARIVVGLRPLLALAVDRMPSLATAAQLLSDAQGGAVLTRGGRCLQVPGLAQHPLVKAHSHVVAVAREHTGVPGSHACFLTHFAHGLVRITVLDFRDERTDHLSALVLVSPGGDLEGLEPTDLHLFGGLLEGWDAPRVAIACGVPCVAEHTQRLAAERGFHSVHALLVHVAARGLFVPPELWS